MTTNERVDLDERLRAAGYRVTGPRRAVWNALRAASGHVTAEQLTAQVTPSGQADQASVYRTLALFEQLGLARQSRLGDADAARWEVAHPDEHFHLVCANCGDIDHHVGSLVSRIRDHLEGDHRFEVRDVELVVTGICARCRDDEDTP